MYVDDIIYTSSSNSLIKQFKYEMMKTFEMTDLGRMNFFLGLEVNQEADGIFVSQRSYIDSILHQLNMRYYKPAVTPMGVNDKPQENSDDLFVDQRMYRSLIGKLLYLTHTRPDICFSVSYLSRVLNQPSNAHFSAAKRVVRYLAGTRDYGLWFSHGDEGVLEAYSDSN